MTFDINRAFKVIPFLWGDFDGERFVQSGFMRTRLPYLWSRFCWIFTAYDIARYLTLAVLPRHYGRLELYLGE